MFLRKSLLVLAVAVACGSVQAQGPSTPAKKELVAKILKLQQPGIEALARDLAKQPAAELLGNAAEYLQTQVPADKRDAIAKGMQADGDRYMNEIYPIVRDKALGLAPSTVGTLLDE